MDSYIYASLMLILQNFDTTCDIAGLNKFSGQNLGHLFSEMLDCCIRVCKSLNLSGRSQQWRSQTRAY